MFNRLLDQQVEAGVSELAELRTELGKADVLIGFEHQRLRRVELPHEDLHRLRGGATPGADVESFWMFAVAQCATVLYRSCENETAADQGGMPSGMGGIWEENGNGETYLHGCEIYMHTCRKMIKNNYQ